MSEQKMDYVYDQEGIEFNCHDQQSKSWKGIIKNHKKHGSHYSLNISARGSIIDVFFGEAAFGQWFVCSPNFNAAAIVGSLRDTFHNSEILSDAMRYAVDGITVAFALKAYAERMDIQEVDGTGELFEQLRKAGLSRIETNSELE